MGPACFCLYRVASCAGRLSNLALCLRLPSPIHALSNTKVRQYRSLLHRQIGLLAVFTRRSLSNWRRGPIADKAGMQAARYELLAFLCSPLYSTDFERWPLMTYDSFAQLVGAQSNKICFPGTCVYHWTTEFSNKCMTSNMPVISQWQRNGRQRVRVHLYLLFGHAGVGELHPTASCMHHAKLWLEGLKEEETQT